MYIVEAVGEERFDKTFKTKEEAKAEFEEAVEKFEKDNGIVNAGSDACLHQKDEDSYTFGDGDTYQAFFIAEYPETAKEEVLLILTEAEYELEHYSFDDSCRGDLEEKLHSAEHIVREAFPDI